MRGIVLTPRRVAGIVMILGCVIFLGAAGLLPRDSHGTFVVNLPMREQLAVIATQSQQWRWSMSLFITGVLVTLLGLVLLTTLLRDVGDHIYSHLALLAFLVGDILFVIHLAFSVAVAPWVALEAAGTGAVPDYYAPLTLWTGTLFVIYTILAFLALMAYGAAMLSTRALPRWVGWLSILYGLAGLGLLGFSGGDAPPFLHHLMPIVFGLLLLLPQQGMRNSVKPPTSAHAP